MFVVAYRKIFYIISALLTVASIAAVSLWGLNLSIDFTGGSILEVAYTDVRPELTEVKGTLDESSYELKSSVRPTGDKGFIIRMRSVTPEEKTAIVAELGAPEEIRFDSIGPVLGGEAIRSAVISILLVIFAIVIFITYAFRKVSEPVSSWKYGVVAIVALIHDIIIPTGVFAVLGHFAGYEVDTLFVTALLVVLGFSVHDTIVVFDRTRENLKHANDRGVKKPFSDIVGESISQTFARSINTSLTTVLALVVLYFVGGEATQHFSLALIIGIVAGTYSSVFLGSPLLVTLEKLQKKS